MNGPPKDRVAWRALLLCVVVLFQKANSGFIQLYDNYHFYELTASQSVSIWELVKVLAAGFEVSARLKGDDDT